MVQRIATTSAKTTSCHIIASLLYRSLARGAGPVNGWVFGCGAGLRSINECLLVSQASQITFFPLGAAALNVDGVNSLPALALTEYPQQ